MKPYASLSLDLDNQWSYMKTHGDPGWETFPSYLDVVVPRFLEILRRHALTITVFVVGQDAALIKNRAALRSIPAAGHEIGNHSFHHEPWLHLYSEAQIEDELARAAAAIEEATGKRPIGFRGPGFSVSDTVLQVLARRGYLYDASTFPTFLGPLARLYYFMTAKLTAQEKAQRKKLFGGLREGLRPLKPYRWRMDDPLVEIPVTTLPGLRVPFHLSYILYLCSFSEALGLAYFRTALWLCRMLNVACSLLLHPLDFLSMEDCPELGFFPAMRLPLARKLAIMERCLASLTNNFHVVTMQEHARLSSLTVLRTVECEF